MYIDIWTFRAAFSEVSLAARSASLAASSEVPPARTALLVPRPLDLLAQVPSMPL